MSYTNIILLFLVFKFVELVASIIIQELLIPSPFADELIKQLKLVQSRNV
jgi:hypothetical protein